MPLLFRGGQTVKVKAPTIIGEILDVQIIDDVPHYHVRFTDEIGGIHQRYFAEHELEGLPA